MALWACLEWCRVRCGDLALCGVVCCVVVVLERRAACAAHGPQSCGVLLAGVVSSGRLGGGAFGKGG